MSKQVQAQVGRTLWIGFEGTGLDADTRATLAAGRAGGAVLFARNLATHEDRTDLDAVRDLVAQLHGFGARSGQRLWVAIDQEGGRVQRIRAPLEHREPMIRFADKPDDIARREAQVLGFAMGQELKDLGIDVNFAPVLDIHTNAENPIIGDRAFAREPEAVAVRALAFARGLVESGVMPCGKHFPGHGDTSTDSHLTLPRLDHDLDRLRSIELAPFAAASQEKLPMIMTAHVVFAALDDRAPATLSRRVVTDLLRGELEYTGVVVSDDLDMKAIVDHVGVADAAIAAIAAGCDVLLLCRNREHQELVRDTLIGEAEKSAAFRQLLGASNSRIAGLAQ